MSIYRYPGPKPFTTEEAAIFRGRTEDVANLATRILQEKLIVLYGKSGLGKSSLLNAGLIPYLARLKKQEESAYDALSIRFHAWYEGREADPISLTQARLPLPEGASYLAKLMPEDDSLWRHFKEYQYRKPTQSDFILLFDQFEELFSFPDRMVDRFRDQLAELLNTKIPQRYRDALEARPDVLTDAEKQLLYQELNVRSILTIRSNRLHQLDRLSTKLPSILRERYQLQPLFRPQAEDAILDPAFAKGTQYLTPPFDYEDEALDGILDFLSKQGSTAVESFQLQIICQYAERNLVVGKGLKRLKLADFGDLSQVFGTYYHDLIAELDAPTDQVAARKLIEEELILEEGEQSRRLSLYQGQIERLGVNQEVLNALVNSHIIRSESDPQGGSFYELAHDTLMEPILRAKAQRMQEEEAQRLKAAYRKRNRRLFAILGLAVVVILVQGVIVWWALTNKWEADANAKVLSANFDFINQDFSTGYEKLTEAMNIRWDQDQSLYDFAYGYERAFDADSLDIAARMMLTAAKHVRVTDSFETQFFEAARYYRDIFAFAWVDSFLQVGTDRKLDPAAIQELYLSTAYTARWVREDTLARRYMRQLADHVQVGWQPSDDLDHDLQALYAACGVRYQDPRMVLVEGGAFMMGGDTLLEPNISRSIELHFLHPKISRSNELLRHRVVLDSFEIGKYEVTWKEYYAFLVSMDTAEWELDRWVYLASDSQDSDVYRAIWEDAGRLFLNEAYAAYPVSSVSWHGAQAYANWRGGALPTEAQWEYAARGGETGDTSFVYAGSSELSKVGWYSGNSGFTVHLIGKKQPNQQGLYDLSGNLWEWCLDVYTYDFYAQCVRDSLVDNPLNESYEKYAGRVVRGGSWYNGVNLCRLPYRGFNHPYSRDDLTGFRFSRYLGP